MRPTKLDDLRAQKIVQAIRDGNTRECAAAQAGVCKATLMDWLARGRAGEKPYSDFLDRVRAADAEAEKTAVTAVVSLFTSEKLGLGAATWWLERRRRQDWGRLKDTEEDRAMTPEEAEAHWRKMTGTEPPWKR